MTLRNSVNVVGRAGHDPATYGLKGRDSGDSYVNVASSEILDYGNHREPRLDQKVFLRGFCQVGFDPLSPLRRWTSGGGR